MTGAVSALAGQEAPDFAGDHLAANSARIAQGCCPARRWLGIDFSGNHLMWRAGCMRSNAWIAELYAVGRGLELVDLRPVQHLAGDGEPFARLVALLRAGDYEAVGVDAPFSVPAGLAAGDDHGKLLAWAQARSGAERPVPTAAQLVAFLGLVRRGNKTWRDCERRWLDCGVFVFHENRATFSHETRTTPRDADRDFPLQPVRCQNW